ncbi:DUF3341 domain-containing protein [bacterium]|nr:DUF3341 domain-containing protein [bacterium]
MASFETPEAVLEAARRTREAGYRCLDAFTPYPVEGLAEAIGSAQSRLPLWVLIGGLCGGLGGFGLQYFSMVHNYPYDVGGRPANSWPAFVPITFELTILAAALVAVFGMLAANGLPRPHHPVFDAPGFERATLDRFFLCVEARDPRFEKDATRRFLESLNPKDVADVAC